MPMIAITTSNSTSVNPPVLFLLVRIPLSFTALPFLIDREIASYRVVHLWKTRAPKINGSFTAS
jgi:hypothetical protein